MTPFHVVELDHDHTDSPGALLAGLRGLERIHRAHDLAFHGNDDQTEPAEAMLVEHVQLPNYSVGWLLALAGPRPAGSPDSPHGMRLLRAGDALDPAEVLGGVRFLLPLRDNLDAVSDVGLHVDREQLRRGIGTALASGLDQVARTEGRHVVMGWMDSQPSEAPDALHPRDGGYAISPSAATAFAAAMGYRLAQAERHSVQHLADYDPVAPQVPAGYRLVSWLGATPEEHLQAMADLLHAMSTDTPTGELDFAEEVWDVDRIRERDEHLAKNTEMLVTLALREADGAVAGFTELNRLITKPAVVNQWNTLVADGHRGHGLGLVLKQANLQQLAQHWPQAERVHTWNAAENDYMWAINERLGYRIASIDSGWQKRLA